MTKECLHCRLQFPDTTEFCPTCGRLTESSFAIRRTQESEYDRFSKQMKENDDLIGPQGVYHDCSSSLLRKECLYCSLQFSDTTEFCPTCGRLTERNVRVWLFASPSTRRFERDSARAIGECLKSRARGSVHEASR